MTDVSRCSAVAANLQQAQAQVSSLQAQVVVLQECKMHSARLQEQLLVKERECEYAYMLFSHYRLGLAQYTSLLACRGRGSWFLGVDVGRS